MFFIFEQHHKKDCWVTLNAVFHLHIPVSCIYTLNQAGMSQIAGGQITLSIVRTLWVLVHLWF